MLERNRTIKPAPERWSDGRQARHPAVITFEERVYDLLVEGPFNEWMTRYLSMPQILQKKALYFMNLCMCSILM